MSGTDCSNGDSRQKSVAKAVSWRILGTLDTMVVSWIITGKLLFAISIGGVEVVTKMVLYYFHERAWNWISFRRWASDDEVSQEPVGASPEAATAVAAAMVDGGMDDERAA